MLAAAAQKLTYEHQPGGPRSAEVGGPGPDTRDGHFTRAHKTADIAGHMWSGLDIGGHHWTLPCAEAGGLRRAPSHGHLLTSWPAQGPDEILTGYEGTTAKQPATGPQAVVEPPPLRVWSRMPGW